MTKIINLLRQQDRILIVIIPLIFITIVFYKFFFHGLITIPTDILTGVYYPWLDFTYGFPVHVPVKNPMPSDVISIIYPWRMLGMAIIKSGYLPLWDDTILLGNPLLANFQSALLNPMNFLFFIFSDPIAWSLQTIFQPVLLYTSMFLFLRHLKISIYASIIGSLLYAFSGFAMVWLEYNSVTYTIVYLPVIFLLTAKIVENPKVKHAFILGILICLQIFSGYPLSTIYTLFFAGLYFIYLQFRIYPKNLKIKLTIFSLGIITGFLLSAIQLLPGLEATSLSIRKFDTTAVSGHIKYLPPSALFNFFIPDLYGNPGTGNYWGEGSYDNFSFFIAGAGVFLFILSLLTKVAYKKENLIYLGFIFLSLIIAMLNPLTDLLSQSDFFGLNAAVNTRVLFVLCFCVAVLAARSFDFISQNKLNFFQKVTPIAVYLGIIIGFGLFYLLTARDSQNLNQIIAISSDPLNPPNQILQKTSQDYLTLIANIKIGFRNLVIPFLVVLLFFFSLWIKNRKILFIFTVILILISAKTSYDKYLNFTGQDIFYPETKSISDLKRLSAGHRFIHEPAEVLPDNTWTPYQLKSPVGQNALVPVNTAIYFSLINNGYFNNQTLTRFIELNKLTSPLINTLDSKSIVLLNRKPIESVPGPNGVPFPWLIQPNWKEEANAGTLRIYNNPANLGPAWFSENVICESSIDKTAPFLVTESYDPGKTMVINCPQGSLQNKTTGQVNSSTSRPNFLQFSVNNPSDNYLNISLTNFPGWQAFIDNEKIPLLRSDIALSSVFVPQGQHTIELFYRPQSFKIGVFLSLGTFLVWLIYFTYLRKFKHG